MSVANFFEEVKLHKRIFGGLNKWDIRLLKDTRLKLKNLQRLLATSAYSKLDAAKMNDFMGKISGAIASN